MSLTLDDRLALKREIDRRKRLRVLASVGPERGTRGRGLPLVPVDYDSLLYPTCHVCGHGFGPLDDPSEAVDLLCRHLRREHLEERED